MKEKNFVCNSRVYKRITKRHALDMLKRDEAFHPQIYLVPFLKGGYRMGLFNFEERFHREYDTYSYVYRDSLSHEAIVEKAFHSVYNEYSYWCTNYNEVDFIGFYLNYEWSDL